MIVFISLLLIIILLLFIYSACAVSSRCSRWEERNNNFKEE